MTNNCKFCHNSGIRYQANGQDDFDAAYCSCKEGKIAEQYAMLQVLPVSFSSSEGQPTINRE